MSDLKVKNAEHQAKMDYAHKEIGKFLKQEFGLDNVNIPYSKNNRLKIAMGRLLYDVMADSGTRKKTYINHRIEYNGKFLEVATKEQVAAVGKHEALHYALMIAGKPFNDGTVLFEALLAKYNLPSHQNNRTIQSASTAVMNQRKVKPKYYAVCPKCKKMVGQWSNVPNVFKFSRSITNCCKVTPHFLGKMTLKELESKVALGIYIGDIPA